MFLSKTDLPPEIVEALRAFNIREVEPLLSIAANPAGLQALARALRLPAESVSDIARRLHTSYPAEVAAAGGPTHPMGHRPPAVENK